LLRYVGWINYKTQKPLGAGRNRIGPTGDDVRRLFLAPTGLLVLALALTIRVRSAESYWPTHSWRTSPPEAQGFDSEALASALKTIRERNIPIHSLLIERNGYLILDAYFFPFKEGEQHDMASATKSITSTLIGIAIGEGRLAGVEQPVLSVFPDRPISYRDARKERLTIVDLLTMRSGLDCRFDHGELTLNQMRASAHWVPFMLNLPMASNPGSTWVYCSGGMHVLSGVISKVTGRNAFAFAQEKLFAPLGIRDASWPSDPDGVSDGWGDLHLQPRDMAKIGYLCALGRLGRQADSAGELFARGGATPLSRAGIRLWVLGLP
jgi:CubicO group peptidase (beta-lactamase class C family)